MTPHEDFDLWTTPVDRPPRARDLGLLRFLLRRARGLRRLNREHGDSYEILQGCRAVYWLATTRLYRLRGHQDLKDLIREDLDLSLSRFKDYKKVGARLRPSDVLGHSLGQSRLIQLADLPEPLRPLYLRATERGLTLAQLGVVTAALEAAYGAAPEEPGRHEQALFQALLALQQQREAPPAPAAAAAADAPPEADAPAAADVPEELRGAFAALLGDPPPPPRDRSVSVDFLRAALEDPPPPPPAPPPRPRGDDYAAQARYVVDTIDDPEGDAEWAELIAAARGPAAAPAAPPPPEDPAEEATWAAVEALSESAAIVARDDGRPYQPLPPRPVPQELPPEAAERRPLTRVGYLGCGTLDPLQFGVIGRTPPRCSHPDVPVGLSYNDCLALAICGPPAQGKTYAVGNVIETAVRRRRGLSHIEAPLAAVVIHYHPNGAYEPELLASANPNQQPAEVERLVQRYGVLPEALGDITVLTLPGYVLQQRRRHPRCQVHGIQFTLEELGIPGIRVTLGLGKNQHTLYSRQVEGLIQRMIRDRVPLTFANLVRCVMGHGFRKDHLRLVLARLQLARQWIDDRRGVRRFLAPGQLLLIDLRGDWLAEQHAHLLIALLGHALLLRPPEAGERRHKALVVLDEFHRYASSPVVLPMVDTMIRERRHLNLNPVLVSQDPMSFPPEILPMLDGIGLLAHHAPEWHRHLGARVEAFRHVDTRLTGALPQGTMLWYFRRWLALHGPAPPFGLLPVELRPRLSQHGGATPAAVAAAAPVAAAPAEEEPLCVSDPLAWAREHGYHFR